MLKAPMLRLSILSACHLLSMFLYLHLKDKKNIPERTGHVSDHHPCCSDPTYQLSHSRPACKSKARHHADAEVLKSNRNEDKRSISVVLFVPLTRNDKTWTSRLQCWQNTDIAVTLASHRRGVRCSVRDDIPACHSILSQLQTALIDILTPLPRLPGSPRSVLCFCCPLILQSIAPTS